MERPNPTEFGASHKGQTPFLQEVYRVVLEKEPHPSLSNLDLAQTALEVIDNPNWVDPALAKEAAHEIMGLRDRSNPEWDARARTIIMTLEGGPLQALYPELAGVDEVHMDQEEVLYRDFQSQQKDKAAQEIKE